MSLNIHNLNSQGGICMKKLAKLMIKIGVKMVNFSLKEDDINLYKLEQTIFDTFLPIQREILEQVSSTIYSKEIQQCGTCSSPPSNLKPEGSRKKKL